MPFYSRYHPLISLDGDSLFVGSNHKYTSFDLKSIIPDYQGYGIFEDKKNKSKDNRLIKPGTGDDAIEITYSGDVSKGSSG